MLTALLCLNLRVDILIGNLNDPILNIPMKTKVEEIYEFHKNPQNYIDTLCADGIEEGTDETTRLYRLCRLEATQCPFELIK